MEYWIDILSEPAIALASHVWQKGKAETWGILSRAIKNEEVSQDLTLYQFVEYICIIGKIDLSTIEITPSLGFDYKQIFDYHIDRLGFHESRKEFLDFYQKDYKSACESLSQRTPSYSPKIPPNPHDGAPATDWEKLFDLHLERLNWQLSREKWLATFDGNYRKACERLSRYSTPPPRYIQPKEKIEFPPLVPIPPTSEPEVLEKVDNWFKTTWRNSNLFRWAVALLVIYLLSIFIEFNKTSSSNFSGPIYPGDTSYEQSDEYQADQFEDYDPYNDLDYFPDITLEPDEPYYFNESPEDLDSSTPCLIKGNISFDTGEKIYHLPGQKFYDSTTVDSSYGERWFCTEDEAQAAGWRKSRE